MRKQNKKRKLGTADVCHQVKSAGAGARLLGPAVAMATRRQQKHEAAPTSDGAVSRSRASRSAGYDDARSTIESRTRN